jgi:hypothetical protein
MLWVTLTITQTSNAQTSARWYFGLMLGLDFSSSPPTVLKGGNTAGVGFNVEASTSVTDNAGNLLFMTAANKIYNGNLVDQGIALSTTTDAAQGHLVVPRPGAANQYYLFTVDATDNACGGIADFGSVRGGRYRIITTTGAGNITVGAENTIAGAGTIAECQLAIPHQNGNDYWWLCHERGTATIRVYLVTNAGVSLDGTFTGGTSFGACTYTSVMKVNSCYNKFALTAGGEISLFNFDYTNGDITLGGTVTENFAYGLEFSPNDSYLFVSTGTSSGETQQVIRFNVGATLTARTLLGATYGSTGKSGHLQLGPDGVIYVAQMSSYSAANYNHYIGAITSPNTGGTFNNQYIAINDAGPNQQAVTMGLPTILREFITEAAPNIDDADLTLSGGNFVFCPNVPYNFAYSFGGSAASVTWNFGDGTGNFSSLSPISHTFTTSGSRTITLTVVDNCGRSKVTTRNAVVQDYPASGDIICGSNQITLDGSGANAANYMWFEAATGGPLLAVGDNQVLPYNPISTAPTSVWVQDFTTSSSLGTLGPATIAHNEGTANTLTRIQTLQNNVFIQSVNLTRHNPGCGCTAGTVTIMLKQGVTTLASSTYSIPATSCGSTQTFHLGFTMPTIGNYSLELSSAGACVPYFGATMYGAFSPVTLAGVATNQGSLTAGNSGPFHNIVLRTSPVSCAARTRIDRNCVLPVSLLYVEGNVMASGYNQLQWATASEENNSHFLVQYASSDLAFTTIAQVKGHGTTSVTTRYEWEDATLRQGISYYRLIQVDEDQTEHAADLVRLDNSENHTAPLLVPNPFSGYSTILLKKNHGSRIEVQDVFGRILQVHVMSAEQQSLPWGADLPSGTYFIKGEYLSKEPWLLRAVKD